jgi:hypothetical protein
VLDRPAQYDCERLRSEADPQDRQRGAVGEAQPLKLAVDPRRLRWPALWSLPSVIANAKASGSGSVGARSARITVSSTPRWPAQSDSNAGGALR